MRLRAAVALVAVALPLAVMAGGYDRTTWGMTLAQVQKLYPGGVVDRSLPDAVRYRVKRTVGFTSASAMANFEFGSGRLKAVYLIFPGDGTMDLKSGRFLLPGDAEAARLASGIREALETKYGKPTVEESTPVPARDIPDQEVLWRSPDGDTAILLQAGPDKDGFRSRVIVRYFKWDPDQLRRDQTKGL